MVVIICGGRKYHLTAADRAWLETVCQAHDITHVLHGAAPGADTEAAAWADAHGLVVVAFPAKWRRYGRAAGPIRNEEMLRFLLAMRLHGDAPIAVLAFPGGHGTANMIQQACQAHVAVWQREEG